MGIVITVTDIEKVKMHEEDAIETFVTDNNGRVRNETRQHSDL